MYIALVVSDSLSADARRSDLGRSALKLGRRRALYKSIWTINPQVLTVFDWLVSECNLRPIDKKVHSLCVSMTCGASCVCLICLLPASARDLADRFDDLAPVSVVCNAYGLTGSNRATLRRAAKLVARLLAECARSECGLLVIARHYRERSAVCCE